MAEFRGHKLLYNAAAHFNASDKYVGGLLTETSKGGIEGLTAICWALAEMSAQAEAMNKYMKHDTQEPLKADALMVTMRPREIVEARQAILDAVIHGLATEEDENKEVDLVLAELQKKTESD